MQLENLEAEQSIIGAVLLGQPVPTLTVADFRDSRHREIWRAMLTLANGSEPVNLLTVADKIDRSIVPVSYLSSMTESIPPNTKMDSYIEIIKNLSLLRRIIQSSSDFIKEARENKNAASLLEKMAATVQECKTELGTNRRRGLAGDVREWVLGAYGTFCLQDISNALAIKDRLEAKNLSKILSRLADEGLCERVPGRNGQYRKIEADCPEVDWRGTLPEPLPIRWPFQIENLVKTYPKNIAVIAGEPNAGKTALLLNFALLNQDTCNVHYFSSEMGPEEMKVRTELFGPFVQWKFHFYERSTNFADVIKPNDINIVDFMEIHDNFYEIGGWLKAIFDRLDRGMALVAIQKNPGSDVGRGGYLSLEKPRLYLSLSNEDQGHILKIKKGKNWTQPTINPNGLYVRFRLVNGCNLPTEFTWKREVPKPKQED